MTTLAANHIIKSYNKRNVVNGVSLHVNTSEVVGLLGPNGAGKTTSFYMMVGLVKADEGKIRGWMIPCYRSSHALESAVWHWLFTARAFHIP